MGLEITRDIEENNKDKIFLSGNSNGKIDENSIIVSAKTDRLDVHISPGGRVESGFTNGMMAGNAYTATVFVEVIEPLLPPLSGKHLKILVDYLDDNGKVLWAVAESKSAPLVPGKYKISVSFTIPNNSKGAGFRLQSGSAHGSVKWSNFEVTKGENTSDLVTTNFDIEQDLSENFDISESIWETLSHIELLSKTDFNSAHQEYLKILHSNQIELCLDTKWLFNKYQTNIRTRLMEALWIKKNLKTLTENIDCAKEISYIDLPVFVFWDKGYDGAPAIVKMCMDAMSREFGSRLHIIDNSNIDSWVDIPYFINNIREKYRAMFSDWLRVTLLAEYGGIWIDSTALVEEGLDDLIRQKFRLKSRILAQQFDTHWQISSWFLVSFEEKNYIFQVMRNILNLYWSQNSHLSEYFALHTFWSIAAQMDEKFKQMWRATPVLKSSKGLELEKHIYEAPENINLKDISNNSKIHKLSYHAYNMERITSKTLHSYLIRNNGRL